MTGNTDVLLTTFFIVFDQMSIRDQDEPTCD